MECAQNVLVILASLTVAGCDKIIEPVFMVHGGAEDFIEETIMLGRLEGVKNAATRGYDILMRGGSAIDAVEGGVKSMEKDPSFNAGYGAVLNQAGEVELDASIMEGSTLMSGAVTGIKHIAYPVSLARLVMEKSQYCMLMGEGAMKVAHEENIPIVANKKLVTKHAQVQLKQIQHRANKSLLEMGGGGGVGAVAIDSFGNLAVAASSGGQSGKIVGRCASTSIVGAGIFADNEVGAVAATGGGEAIIRYSLAHEIISLMKRGFDARFATTQALKSLDEIFHTPAGAITVSKTGQIGITFMTEKMPWAYMIRDSLHFGLDDYDYTFEKSV